MCVCVSGGFRGWVFLLKCNGFCIGVCWFGGFMVFGVCDVFRLFVILIFFEGRFIWEY